MVHIRIIKSGKKEYHYLEHTVREGGKFVNKRQYLGSTMPKNIEELKELFANAIYEEKFAENLLAVKKQFKAEFSKYPATAKEKYIESFMVKFTYDTNRIEGSTLTLRETSDLLEEHITPGGRPLKDVKETESHKRVFYEMLEWKKDMSLSTVLKWHSDLLKETDPEIAGRIRKHPVAIARSKAQLAIPAEIDARLHEFFNWYRKMKDKMNPVILSGMVHLRFVTIHPFSDGNGRMSRLLMNFVLSKHDYPMLDIKYDDRAAYYTALERSQTTGENHIFVRYLIKKYLKEYRMYLKRK